MNATSSACCVGAATKRLDSATAANVDTRLAITSGATTTADWSGNCSKPSAWQPPLTRQPALLIVPTRPLLAFTTVAEKLSAPSPRRRSGLCWASWNWTNPTLEAAAKAGAAVGRLQGRRSGHLGASRPSLYRHSSRLPERDVDGPNRGRYGQGKCLLHG